MFLHCMFCMTFLFISGCNISQTNTISFQTLRNFSHSAYSDQSLGVLFDKKKSISRNKRPPDSLRSLRRGRPYCLQVNNFRKVPFMYHFIKEFERNSTWQWHSMFLEWWKTTKSLSNIWLFFIPTWRGNCKNIQEI